MPTPSSYNDEAKGCTETGSTLRGRPLPRFAGPSGTLCPEGLFRESWTAYSVCYNNSMELERKPGPLLEGISWIRMLTRSFSLLPSETPSSCSDSVSDSIDGGNCLRPLPLPCRGGWIASSESRWEVTAWLAECDRLDSSSEAMSFLTLEL